MKMFNYRVGMVAGALLLGQAAIADHNSPWGEGWANMPNDIHNTRIDTLGDRDAFRDFVRYGNGAESVNRFATDSTSRGGQRFGGGLRSGGMGGRGMGGGRGR
jgi:hypothetical protein